MAKARNGAKTAAPRKGQSAATRKSRDPEIGPLELSWTLGELPSAQHKTGLAGLVLMVRWLQRQPARKGLCELTRVDADGAMLRIDRQGMRELFDETYAATAVEREESKPRKGRDKEDILPIRTVEREVKDERGRPKTKTYYVYPATEPKGAFLAELDESSVGGSGAWIKMWRSFVWGLLRAIPATRGPFEERASGFYTKDADDAFDEIAGGGEAPKDLPSTYFLGAQAQTAENVPFRDRTRFQFLLHFWPLAVGLYVPAIVDVENKREFCGYALAFPDLSDLSTWCDEMPQVLRERGSKLVGYLPAEAVVDLPAESALDLAGRLFKRISAKSGASRTSDLLLGIEVIHAEKEGNNVRVRSTARVEPTPAMTDEYDRLRVRFWDPLFRRRILENYLAGRPIHEGFARLFETQPYQRFFQRDGSYFKRDARIFFLEDDCEVNA
jgi:CRISPR-associated protein Cmx8